MVTVSASSLGAPTGRALIFLLTSQRQHVQRLSHWNRPKVGAMWRQGVPLLSIRKIREEFLVLE